MSDDLFSDPAWATPALLRAVAQAAARPSDARCDDCGKGIRIAGRSYITDNLQGRVYCDPCARVRVAHGWEFDARPIAVLRKEVA